MMDGTDPPEAEINSSRGTHAAGKCPVLHGANTEVTENVMHWWRPSGRAVVSALEN